MKDIWIHPALQKQIRALPKKDRRAVGQAIADAQLNLGQPHLHKGIGLQKLNRDLYEIRVGLKRRLVFQQTQTTLQFKMMGNHDDVQRFVRSH